MAYIIDRFTHNSNNANNVQGEQHIPQFHMYYTWILLRIGVTLEVK